ncbi:hypothetical protein PoB_000662000 [Plakobranchus ocellatus]|uniref:Uncharacterized protein n=1 Tax=Plakobranchus ocellatus TaxID=259542 RepID=A0AAV3YBI5_9GAST|nr:hypothetical protein PoB_000662000 [Plakobranchus ocellatus]
MVLSLLPQTESQRAFLIDKYISIGELATFLKKFVMIISSGSIRVIDRKTVRLANAVMPTQCSGGRDVGVIVEVIIGGDGSGNGDGSGDSGEGSGNCDDDVGSSDDGSGDAIGDSSGSVDSVGNGGGSGGNSDLSGDGGGDCNGDSVGYGGGGGSKNCNHNGFLLLDYVSGTYVLHRLILIRKSQCLKIQRLWYPAIGQNCVASIELHEYRYRLKEQESKRRRWQRSQADPIKDPREQARKTSTEEN